MEVADVILAMLVAVFVSFVLGIWAEMDIWGDRMIEIGCAHYDSVSGEYIRHAQCNGRDLKW